MTGSRGRCAICDQQITKETDSGEHVVPNSIGGRKKVRGFICNPCNNSVGKTWDAKLASQLNWFCVAIGIARDRGKSPDEIVKAVDGKEFRIGANGTMTLKDPLFQVVEENGMANVTMFARSPSEARQMLDGLKKKYSEFDLEAALKEIEMEAFKVGMKWTRNLGQVFKWDTV